MLEDDVFVKHPSTVAHSSTVSSSQTYYDVILSYTTSSFVVIVFDSKSETNRYVILSMAMHVHRDVARVSPIDMNAHRPAYEYRISI